MAVEGMQAVQARISQIEARFGVSTPARTDTSARAGKAGSTGPASFDSVFASMLTAPGAASAGGASSAATVRPPGNYGPIQRPAALAGFDNGRVPPAQLVPIADGTEHLLAPAADAFKRMTSDAWRAGVDLKVNDAYRSFEDQKAVAAELGLYRDGGRAAVPGTSTHGWGLSLDVETGGGALEWLRANAARYGFVEDVPREPWHWTFRPDS